MVQPSGWRQRLHPPENSDDVSYMQLTVPAVCTRVSSTFTDKPRVKSAIKQFIISMQSFSARRALASLLAQLFSCPDGQHCFNPLALEMDIQIATHHLCKM